MLNQAHFIHRPVLNLAVVTLADASPRQLTPTHQLPAQNYKVLYEVTVRVSVMSGPNHLRDFCHERAAVPFAA